MSTFLDQLFRTQPASALATNTGALVDVSEADPPLPGDVLTALDAEHALWMPPLGSDATARAAAAAAQATADAAVPKALFDPNTVIAADVDNTPHAITMPPSTALIRLASGNIRAGTVAELQGLIGYTPPVGGGSTPLWVTPAARGFAPDARDDEFDSNTLNAAWQCYDQANNVNRTMTLNLSFTTAFVGGATTPPRYAVHNSGTHSRASWLRVQASDAAGTQYITKPGSLAVGEWMWARVLGGGWVGESSSNDNTYFALLLIGTTGGLPAITKIVRIAMSRTGAAQAMLQLTTNDTGGGGTNNTSVTSWALQHPEPFEYLAIFRQGTANYLGYMFNEAGQFAGLGLVNVPPGVSNIATLDRVGIQINTQHSAGFMTAVPHVGLDFIRFSTTCPF